MDTFTAQVVTTRHGVVDVLVYGAPEGVYVATPHGRPELPVTQAPQGDEPNATSPEAAVEGLRRALERT